MEWFSFSLHKNHFKLCTKRNSLFNVVKKNTRGNANTWRKFNARRSQLAINIARLPVALTNVHVWYTTLRSEQQLNHTRSRYRKGGLHHPPILNILGTCIRPKSVCHRISYDSLRLGVISHVRRCSGTKVQADWRRRRNLTGHSSNQSPDFCL